MRIFALETDQEKIQKKFLCEGEQVLMVTRYHALSFFFSSLREIAITVLTVIAAAAAIYFGAQWIWTIGIAIVAWLVFVFFNFLKALIDWRYDLLIITTDRIILMDQSSIFHQKINPISIENIGSVSAETQYWGVFPFGAVILKMKGGQGGEQMELRYVPNAPLVAAKISEVVTAYQRSVQNPESVLVGQMGRE